jgi:CheY-like chemotaxis protein
MVTLLELAGCEAATAGSGVDVVDRASAFASDVVIIELFLDEMSGFELAKQLSAAPRTENLVLIATTWFCAPGIESDAMNAGFYRYIAKPAPLSKILNTLAPIAEVLGCQTVAWP